MINLKKDLSLVKLVNLPTIKIHFYLNSLFQDNPVNSGELSFQRLLNL